MLLVPPITLRYSYSKGMTSAQRSDAGACGSISCAFVQKLEPSCLPVRTSARPCASRNRPYAPASIPLRTLRSRPRFSRACTTP